MQLAAKQDDPDAIYQIGMYYENGWGVTADITEAYRQYHLAAEKGHPKAQTTIGIELYNKGEYNQAVEWFEKSAEQGFADAQYYMARCYHNGHGVEQNYEEEAAYYQKAARQGHTDALYNMGYCHMNGVGVEENVELAAQCFKKAAQNGDAEAQYITAILCESGIGCEADIDEATHWYTQAAEQGHAAAQEWIAQKK